jgi:hypothetical protein
MPLNRLIYVCMYAVVDGWPHVFLVASEDIQGNHEVTMAFDEGKHAYTQSLNGLNLTSDDRAIAAHCGVNNISGNYHNQHGYRDRYAVDYGVNNSDHDRNVCGDHDRNVCGDYAGNNSHHIGPSTEDFCEEDEQETDEDSEEKRALEENVYVESEVRRV